MKNKNRLQSPQRRHGFKCLEFKNMVLKYIFQSTSLSNIMQIGFHAYAKDLIVEFPMQPRTLVMKK